MTASRIRHVGFVVKDLERSLAFYRGILGLAIYKRETEEGEYIEKLVGIKGVRVEWAKLEFPHGGLIELLQYHSHPDGGVASREQRLPSNRLASGHLAITVSHLDELYKTLIAKGYECNSPPLLSPGGKTKILYAHDPDGIIIELIEELPTLVTVAIPTYNRGATFLRETIDSVLAQTYKHLDILISDNGSTDNTEAVCEEYVKRDPRIRYVRQTVNIGPTANFNALHREARGDYFAQLCDDDLLAPTFVERCVARLAANPDAAVAMSNFVEFDSKGRQAAFDPRKFSPSRQDRYGRLKEYILMYEADGKDRLMWGVWRRDAVLGYVFDERPFPDPPGWDFEDMSLVFEGLTKGSCEMIDEVLFYKRAEPKALDAPRHKPFLRRMFDTFVHSRLRRLVKPFFYKRMRVIMQCDGLTAAERTKLLFWNLFVMTRLFWERKI